MGIGAASKSAENNLITLSRLRNGDERILNKLYKQYFDKLLYFGLQHLNDEFAVTNIIHECFIKAWDYRETMQRVDHFYFFIRMNMKWHFQKHYGNARYRFYRSTFLIDRPEEQFADIAMCDIEMEVQEITEERLGAIYKAIPLLPMNRSNVMLLHYKYGLSYKAIAKRIGFTNKKVIAELEKSIKSIKAMLSVKEAKVQHRTVKVKPLPTDSKILCSTTVLRLRKEEQLSFEDIASMYQMNRAEVLKIYLDAIKGTKTP